MRTRFSLLAVAIPLLPAIGNSQSPTRPTHPEGTYCKNVTGFSGRPFGLHVTRNGDIIVTAQDVSRIVHLDSSLRATSYLGVGEDPGDVIANRAGTWAYISGFHDGTIAILDLVADSVTRALQLPTRNAYRLALSPNERLLYITTTNGMLLTLDPYEESVGATKRLRGSLQGLALDHGGGNLYVSSNAGDLWRLDRASLRTIKETALGCPAQEVALSKDDMELYVACENGNVLVLDPRTLEGIDSIPVPTGSAFGLAVTPDNVQLYVTAPSSGNVTIIDRASRQIVRSVYVRGLPRRVAFSPRGNVAYVTNEWNWLTLIK